MSIAAFNVREKHLTLRNNLRTFAKEDEALDLLTRLNWELPIFVISSAMIDLLLAVVYLKWLHPWKIILQDVSSKSLLFLCQHLIQFQRSRKTGTPTTGKGRTIWSWKRLEDCQIHLLLYQLHLWKIDLLLFS